MSYVRMLIVGVVALAGAFVAIEIAKPIIEAINDPYKEEQSKAVDDLIEAHYEDDVSLGIEAQGRLNKLWIIIATIDWFGLVVAAVVGLMAFGGVARFVFDKIEDRIGGRREK